MSPGKLAGMQYRLQLPPISNLSCFHNLYYGIYRSTRTAYRSRSCPDRNLRQCSVVFRLCVIVLICWKAKNNYATAVPNSLAVYSRYAQLLLGRDELSSKKPHPPRIVYKTGRSNQEHSGGWVSGNYLLEATLSDGYRGPAVLDPPCCRVLRLTPIGPDTKNLPTPSSPLRHGRRVMAAEDAIVQL